MTGSGEHPGYVGIRLITGGIILHGGDLIIASILLFIGIIAIGIITIILFALIALDTTTIIIIMVCITMWDDMTMLLSIQSVPLLLVMLRKILAMLVA